VDERHPRGILAVGEHAVERPRTVDVRVTTPLSESLVDAIRSVRTWERRLTLLVYHHDGAERVVLNPDTPVTIGRAPPSQVRIRDDSLSREHARFTHHGRSVLVEDLGSLNGTWIAGDRVTGGEMIPGDEVMLGNVLVCVRALSEDDGALPGVTSHERFRVALEEEVVRARHFGRRCAVVMIRAAGGRGVPYGRFCNRVRALLRPVDRIGLYSADVAAVLLVESSSEAALELAQALTATPSDGGEALLAGVAPFPEAATTAEKLLELCWAALRGATPAAPVQAAPLGTWTSASGAAVQSDEPIVVSPPMVHVFNTLTKLGRSQVPVLLLGETGTGKEVVARALHQRSPRRARPMVSVNCGAIPQHLVESTFFGHERGAFTGAVQQQRGVFEAADGGTVFLDEIGELPPSAQSALLRVLETRRVVRVGSSREIEVDVRVVAATHRDLEAMSESGAFRLDLLYRLDVMTLTIPPLRERPEEVEPLVMRFLRQANEAAGLSVRGIDPGAMALLRSYAWPGNVRELRNAIERAVVVADGPCITEADLPQRIRAARAAEPPSEREDDDPGGDAPADDAGFKARLQRYEAGLIVEALRDAGWNQTAAAHALGMPLRTLVHKIRALGIKKLGFGAGRDAA
jgi:DNA-binding NtrC family response regulator